MSVVFASLDFHNRTEDLTLTIEAPCGTIVVNARPIARDASETFSIGSRDCSCVLISTLSPTHGRHDQEFAIEPPRVGRPAYFTRMHVQYYVASFETDFEASTDRVG